MLPVPRPANACDEAGMSTAEYAVGTCAAVGLAGILYKLLTSPEIQEMLWAILEKAVAAFV